ncbi:probable serine/threonine-protein kinase At1g54610 isoform X3 [Sesamum indicum]|uniref:Probable serine/threonine-protein kinase At1g54610 isoform X3 n=1 Tax=Sesamum indicum TaxID=4182 RepID=A0A8M8UW95_SESIN|nr:probable serine/threonine-protein kinase At1g54610 isoform X3 [Sesamum indicum]
MGCVLGKRAAGRRQTRRKPENDETRASESAAGAVQNGANERAEEKNNEEVSTAAGRRRRLPPAAPEFRLGPGVSTAAEGWPSWLVDVAGNVIKDWKPRRANTFEKLDKIGQGTYSNVYKARDLITGKVVALKKVRFDNLEPETVKFMAREILVLKRLNHPNVIKLEGLVISRMSSSLYLVFEYMEHDLAGLTAMQSVKFTEPEVKCYMKQLLSGLEHCHNNGVLHRDIKCSNLLIDNEGVLKIADFGLASFFDPEHKKPMTSRVVTLWYRPPELLLGDTYYGVGVDLWSAGCILAELLAGKPILRGRTEVEQLHKIFKLCGSPTEEYWKKSRLPNATLYKPQQPYKRCIMESFKEFPQSSLGLIDTLLSIDPDARGSATAALNSEFFTTEPYACEPSSLPKFPPSKEMDIKLRDEESRSKVYMENLTQLMVIDEVEYVTRSVQFLLQKLMRNSKQIWIGYGSCQMLKPRARAKNSHRPIGMEQSAILPMHLKMALYHLLQLVLHLPPQFLIQSHQDHCETTVHLKVQLQGGKTLKKSLTGLLLDNLSKHSIHPPLGGRWISGSAVDQQFQKMLAVEGRAAGL